MRHADGDIAVVGGGIVGHAIAFELAQRKVAFTWIRPDDTQGSATLAAGAMIGAFGELTADRSGTGDDARLAFRVRAQDEFRSWLAAIEEAAPRRIFRRDGMFLVGAARSAEDDANLRHIRQRLDAYGRRCQDVAVHEVPLLEPDEDHAIGAALFIPDDLSVDIVHLLAALAIATRDHARVVAARVAELRENGGRWRLLTDRGDAIWARSVVLATGAHVPSVLGDALLSRLRLPTFYFAKGIGAVISDAPAFPHAIRTPNRSHACGLHVVPRAGGRLYIGASNHFGFAPAAAHGVTPGELDAIVVDTVRQLHRGLRDATIEELRFGLRPITGDEQPLVGPTELEGLHLATGTWRTGIVMAPLLGRIVADGLLGRVAAIDHPFAPSAERGDPETTSLNCSLLAADRALAAYHQYRRTGRAEDASQALACIEAYQARPTPWLDARILALADVVVRGGEEHEPW